MTILEAVADRQLFGGLPAFRDLSTWRTWCVFLAAVYGLPFSVLATVGVTECEAESIYIKHTGRSTYVPRPGGFPEAAAIVGRQAGKDRIGSLVQAHEAMLATPEPDGTEIFSLAIAQDARASLRTQFSYARSPFRRLPLLRSLVRVDRGDALELTTGVTLASYPCRPQAVRGVRARVVVLSELAFYRSAEGNPVDQEMVRAVRPTLATTGGRLLILSSPYGDSGALYDLHRRHFGKDDSDVLIWQATAPEMNPSLPADYLTRMERDDPEAYRSEVLGEFRAGLAQLFDPDALAACVASDVRERLPERGRRYLAHTDAASGTGTDAWTLAIAHADEGRAVLDVCRAWRPPFHPGRVAAEAAGLLRHFELFDVEGDRYAPGFVAESFATHGVRYHYADRDRSGIDPIAWTRSERWIRCPAWRKMLLAGASGGSSLKSSRTAPCAWFLMKARPSARSPASWT